MIKDIAILDLFIINITHHYYFIISLALYRPIPDPEQIRLNRLKSDNREKPQQYATTKMSEKCVLC